MHGTPLELCVVLDKLTRRLAAPQSGKKAVNEVISFGGPYSFIVVLTRAEIPLFEHYYAPLFIYVWRNVEHNVWHSIRSDVAKNEQK